MQHSALQDNFGNLMLETASLAQLDTTMCYGLSIALMRSGKDNESAARKVIPANFG